MDPLAVSKLVVERYRDRLLAAQKARGARVMGTTELKQHLDAIVSLFEPDGEIEQLLKSQ